MQETSGIERAMREPRKLPLRPVDRETVQDRVYREIKDLILNGGIEPGQTVTIQGLSDAFQVSTMPVREALRRLMAEQALMVVSGRSVGIPALRRWRHPGRRNASPHPSCAAWASWWNACNWRPTSATGAASCRPTTTSISRS